MAEGLLDDCRELLSRFESHESVRFEVFSQVWREMNFSFIHCGKKDANGRIQIVDYLFRIMTSYLSPSCSLIIREGAVYALYGIYNTQLCNPKVKIRMTLSMWKDFNELQELIQQLKHHDADFIIRSLKNSKAFLFCAARTPLSYGSREAIISHEKENNTKISADADKIIERTCGILERLHSTHMGYKEAKESVMLLPSAAEYSRSLDTASSSFDIDLASDIEEFHSWKQAHCQKFLLNEKNSSILMIPDRNIVKRQKIDEPSAQLELQMNESQRRSKRISDLKTQSFQQLGKVSRSMRHLSPSLHSDHEENSGSNDRS